MVNHRFVSECTDGRVDAPVYRAYLEQEFAFLETAAVALGHAVVDAPSFAEVRRFADALHGLVTDQRQYFERAFASDCAPHWGPIESSSGAVIRRCGRVSSAGSPAAADRAGPRVKWSRFADPLFVADGLRGSGPDPE